jgi:hypothetical protein
MVVPGNIEISSPWRILAPSEADDAERLTAELARELTPGHPLHGLKVKAIARRIDRDDILYEVDDASSPLAMVHLTWSKGTDPRWPKAKLFRSWEHWFNDEMRSAHGSA